MRLRFPRSLALRGALIAMAGGASGCVRAEVDTCGTGSWQPGALEIHHLAIGQADATLVVAPSGRTLMVDLGEETPFSVRAAEKAGGYLYRTLGCRRLDYVLITHFHLDHVGAPGGGGLWHLVQTQGFSVGATFHRDLLGIPGERGHLQRLWRSHLQDGAADSLRPTVVTRDASGFDLGPDVSVRVVAVDGQGVLRSTVPVGASRPNENDLSVALHLRFGRLDYFIGGDLSGELAPAGPDSSYHDLETGVARELPDLDVLRVSHHGSDHSSNTTFLGQTDPEVAIISVGDGNRHGHPRGATLERLASTAAVYLTQRGDPGTALVGARVVGDIVVRSWDGDRYTVAGDTFRATDPRRVDADGDGYFVEADPDDGDSRRVPAPRGGCDPFQLPCPGGGW